MSKIQRKRGDKMIFSGGPDAYSPHVVVVESDYHGAMTRCDECGQKKHDGSLALSIDAGPDGQISLETLQEICKWAEGH